MDIYGTLVLIFTITSLTIGRLPRDVTQILLTFKMSAFAIVVLVTSVAKAQLSFKRRVGGSTAENGFREAKMFSKREGILRQKQQF